MRTVVHKGSGGIATALPDVCKTPAPPAPSPVPIPYPNIARSSDTAKGSKKTKCDGKPIMLKNSEFSRSTGDEAGTLKGIASNTNMGKAKFAMYSFDVKVEGKNVPRLGDPMLSNGNAPNTATVAELQAAMGIAPAAWPYAITNEQVKIICEAICACKDSTSESGSPTKSAYKHKQACVADQLSSNKEQGTKNRLYDQKHKNIHVEQPFDMTQPTPALIRSGLRTTLGGAPTGASLFKGIGRSGQLVKAGRSPMYGAYKALNSAGTMVTRGHVRRPDILLTKNSTRIAQGANIKQIIDVKFGPDSLSPGQKDAYDAINPKAPPLLVMDESDESCDCQ